METSARRAARLLERLFAPLPHPVGFRLWDGSVVRAGPPGEPGFAIVLPTRRIFRRLLARPTPYRFGEAYVEGGLDIEGDVLAAMRAGQHLEDLRRPLTVRLAALAEVVRP